MPNRSHIALLTDYGTDDEFVGVLKSVIIDAAPHVRITDITHGIAPFDVRAGSLALCRAIQYVPDGIVLAVVDPGVGTARRAVAVEVAGGAGILLGPDNGLLAPAVALAGGAERAFALENSALHLAAPGATFAGRDIFAPVAAFLCNGGDLAEVGPEVDAALLVPGVVPLPSDTSHDEHGRGLRCEVTWVDRFGNCQLNLGPDEAPARQCRLVFDDAPGTADGVRSAGICGAYGEIPHGGIGLVIDSYGMLAICLDRDSAAERLGIGVGTAVSLYPASTGPAPAPVSLRRQN